MGMGIFEQPNYSIHTSYGLTWQWTLAPGGAPSPTPTPTSSANPSPTPPATATRTPYGRGNSDPHADPVTFSNQNTDLHADPDINADGHAHFDNPVLHGDPGFLRPHARTPFSGLVAWAGAPSNNQRVVFSYVRDGRGPPSPP